MMCKYFLAVLFGYLICGGEAAKILMVLPAPSYSHFTIGFRLAKELAEKGHQVTSINPYPQKTPIKNYRDISVAENVEIVEKIKNNLFSTNSQNPLQSINFIFELGEILTTATYSNKNVQELLNSGETFDVVVIEHFLNDAHLGFAHHFNAPAILLSSNAASIINNYIFANPAPSSYVPNVRSAFTPPMNFWQRIQNLFYNTLFEVMININYLPQQGEIFKKFVTTDVEFEDVLYNVSLMLTNSHVSVHGGVPHVPSIIEIGGYHVSPPKKLPEDLQKFLDDSKEGVILFSMGSNLRSKDLQPEVRDAILKAFSKLKQKVLWKFEADLPNAPKNVKIMNWVPQQDVLAHPNVQAFISHGGLLSTIEAVYFGVPIVGIPVYGDQEANIARAAANEYAVAVPLNQVSEEKLSWALNEILNNPKYRENIKQRSQVMHDQPLKPIDAAVFWVEHVIRHKGAHHLRSAGLDLKWYQRHMVDVIMFLTAVIIIFFVTFYVIFRKTMCLLFGKKKPKTSKSKKNQ